MKNLLIDTSTECLVIILSEGIEVVDHTFKIVKRNHSSQLMPNIDQLLKRNDVDIVNIKQIIVSEGPGSYTGVRIGVTVAKTLCYALNIPLKKISSLKLMSASFMNKAKYIVPLIDARRGNVFSALYEVKHHKLKPVFDEKLYHFDDYVKQIKEKVKDDICFVGMDFEKIDYNPQFIMNLDFENVSNIHTFVPSYKRLPEAELKLR